MTEYDANCPACGCAFRFNVPDELISIKEAAAKGIDKVRMPRWANLEDYLKIDILKDGAPGPWTHLFSPENMEINGRNPVDVPALDYDVREYVPWLPVSRRNDVP